MADKKVELGQYYTPEVVANWIVSLARSAPDAPVLEPSAGPGAFLDALISRGFSNIEALEIDPRSVRMAKKMFSPRVRMQEGDFLLFDRQPRYSLVVGNPPYVRWGNMSEQTKKILQSDPFWSRYSSGEWDLLYAFLIGGAEMLQDGGEMIFVVPYNWFTATYARPVRQYLLSNGHFSDIIHFGEYKLFPDAAPNAIVFRWQKSLSKEPIRVVDFLGRKGQTGEIIKKIESLREGLERGEEREEANWRSFLAPQFSSDQSWYLASRDDAKFCQTLEKVASQKLSEVADVGVGMVSGYDQAFLLDDTAGFSAKEQKFIFPFVKARDCHHFFLGKPSYFIWVDKIGSEEELRGYPGLWKHLRAHKEALLGRYGAKPELWWHWATVRNADLFRKNERRPKTFLPCADRAEQARFSATPRAYWGSGDVLLVAAKEDPWFLQSWLGSELLNRWYQIRGPQTGQRRRYTQSFVEGLPVVPPQNIAPNTQRQLRALAKTMARESDPERREESLRLLNQIWQEIVFASSA